MRALLYVPTKREFPREQALEALLVGLVVLNRGIMRTHRIPPLYDAGVRYAKDASEVWMSALDVMQRRKGDCGNLAAWRAAELQEQGINAHVCVERTGRNRLHAMVCIGNRVIEDPSRRLGMGKKKR